MKVRFPLVALNEILLRMVKRRFWIDLIEKAWEKRSIIWLAGVRRAGKTYFCRSLPNIEYFDCELPRTRRMMEDPEGFLESRSGKRIVLDEIHRLDNPSELLKIAADHFPSIRIIATGSSTLSASTKFKDTLAGRKRDLWLTPMCLFDLTDTKQRNLRRRFVRGGLPPFFLSEAMVGYWRDKRGHEIDFVLAGRRKNPLAIECKWSAGKFEPRNLEAFRRQHPEGDNVVLAEDVKQPFTRNYGTLKVRFEGLESFVSQLAH